MVWCFSVANALATAPWNSSASLRMPTSLSRMKSLCRQTVRSPQVKELLFQEGAPKAILFLMEPHFFRRQVASSQNKVCKLFRLLEPGDRQPGWEAGAAAGLAELLQGAGCGGISLFPVLVFSKKLHRQLLWCEPFLHFPPDTGECTR